MFNAIINLFYNAFYFLYDEIFCASIYGVQIYQIALAGLVAAALMRMVIAPFFGTSINWRMSSQSDRVKDNKIRQYNKTS
jgi:hypothetical protein